MIPSIVTICNKGMIELTDNLLNSISKSGMKNDIYIVYLDNETKDYYKGSNLIKPVKNNFKYIKSEYCDYGTRTFRNICSKKLPSVLEILTLTKKDVIFIDSDIYIFNDFNKYIAEYSDYDLICSVENDSTYCSGFIYYKYSDNTIRFIKEHISLMENKVDSKIYYDDQSVFNDIIRNGFEIDNIGLPEECFCNGHYVMTNHVDISNIFTIHANHIVGLDNKKRLLNEFIN